MDRNLKFLGLGAAIRWFGTSLVYPFVGLYLRIVLKVGYAEIGLVLFVIAAAPLVVSPFGGMIVDRVGRRRILLAALAGETLGVFLLALSMQAGWFPGIVITGMAIGVAGNVESPASSAYVADYAEGSDRTRAFSWIRIGFNAGFSIGVFSGGVFVVLVGFPTTGFVSAAFIGSATLALAFLLSPSPYDISRKLNPEEHRISAGPGSVRQSFRILGSDRRFLLLSLAFAFASATYSQWNTTFPIYVNSVAGVPIWLLGFALALNGVIVVFGQAPITNLMIGRRHTTVAIISSVLLIGAFLALGFLGLSGATLVAGVFAFVILLTLGEDLGALPFMTMPSNMAPRGEIGSYNGAFGLIVGLGAALAPSLGGLTLSFTGNPLVVWSLLALPSIPSILLFRLLGKTIPESANKV